MAFYCQSFWINNNGKWCRFKNPTLTAPNAQASVCGQNSLGDRRRRIGSRQSDDEMRTSAPTTYVQDATTAHVKQYNANYSSRTDAIHVQTTVPSDTHHVTPTSERPIADSENSISLRHFILNHFNTEKGRQNSLYEDAWRSLKAEKNMTKQRWLDHVLYRI